MSLLKTPKIINWSMRHLWHLSICQEAIKSFEWYYGLSKTQITQHSFDQTSSWEMSASLLGLWKHGYNSIGCQGRKSVTRQANCLNKKWIMWISYMYSCTHALKEMQKSNNKNKLKSLGQFQTDLRMISILYYTLS